MDDPSPIVDYESKDRPEPDVSRLAELSSAFQSPQTRGLIFQALAIVGGLALLWVIVATILSVFNVWMIILLVVVIGAVVFVREFFAKRREGWIQQGFCAACGYDLNGEPVTCPHCGRDARLDEPVWRRMRRELEAKLLATAQQEEIVVTPAPPRALPPSVPPPVPPSVRIVTRRPIIDDGPIPLEGDEPTSAP